MGLPSEMPKYENRLVWYRVAAVSSNPVASAKKAFISSRVPRPCSDQIRARSRSFLRRVGHGEGDAGRGRGRVVVGEERRLSLVESGNRQRALAGVLDARLVSVGEARAVFGGCEVSKTSREGGTRFKGAVRNNALGASRAQFLLALEIVGQHDLIRSRCLGPSPACQLGHQGVRRAARLVDALDGGRRRLQRDERTQTVGVVGRECGRSEVAEGGEGRSAGVAFHERIDALSGHVGGKHVP